MRAIFVLWRRYKQTTLLVWGVEQAQRCFALAKPRAGVASAFADEQKRLVTQPPFLLYYNTLFQIISCLTPILYLER